LSQDSGSPQGIREVDLALHLEAKARELGAEGMGFETLAAGPERSYAIHCYPTVTAGMFGGRGFSILDFGVVVDGYTSDVTVTAVRGPLSSRQEEMLKAVRGAYELSSALCRPGAEPREVAAAVEEYFQSRSLHMPHALGHGIGLEAHEYPLLRTRKNAAGAAALQEGMVFTLEPGLYEPGEGGIRLENDFLVVGDGVQTLTSARLIRL
jgi:Xaa-Pro dipeptidase